MPFVAGLDLRVADATNGTAWLRQTLCGNVRARDKFRGEVRIQTVAVSVSCTAIQWFQATLMHAPVHFT